MMFSGDEISVFETEGEEYTLLPLRLFTSDVPLKPLIYLQIKNERVRQQTKIIVLYDTWYHSLAKFQTTLKAFCHTQNALAKPLNIQEHELPYSKEVDLYCTFSKEHKQFHSPDPPSQHYFFATWNGFCCHMNVVIRSRLTVSDMH